MDFCWGWFWKKETTSDPLFPKSPSLTPLRLPEESVAPPAPRAPRPRAKGARKKEPPKEFDNAPCAKAESEKEFDDRIRIPARFPLSRMARCQTLSVALFSARFASLRFASLRFCAWRAFRAWPGLKYIDG